MISIQTAYIAGENIELGDCVVLKDGKLYKASTVIADEQKHDLQGTGSQELREHQERED